MANRTLIATVPPLSLTPGMIVKLEAIDPTSGAAVTGVTATKWAIYGTRDDQDTDNITVKAAAPVLTYGPGGT